MLLQVLLFQKVTQRMCWHRRVMTFGCGMHRQANISATQTTTVPSRVLAASLTTKMYDRALSRQQFNLLSTDRDTYCIDSERAENIITSFFTFRNVSIKYSLAFLDVRLFISCGMIFSLNWKNTVTVFKSGLFNHACLYCKRCFGELWGTGRSTNLQTDWLITVTEAKTFHSSEACILYCIVLEFIILFLLIVL